VFSIGTKTPRDERLKLLERLQEIRRSRVITCITSDRPNATGVIAKDFMPRFYNHLKTFEPRDRIDIFLFTTGGDTLAAFGLSRMLREFGAHIGALIPEKCHSAGTLLVLGANEIFMTRGATLTPIDPSVTTPLNPRVELAPGLGQTSIPVSVENIAGFKDLVREEWHLGDHEAGAALQMLAQAVNPLVLGQAFRSRQQIDRLARALLGAHRTDNEKIGQIIEVLSRGLGSHDYLISRREAREVLGAQVLGDNAALEDAVWKLYAHYAEDMELGRIFDANAALQAHLLAGKAAPAKVLNRIVIIESQAGTDVWENELHVSPFTPAPGVRAAPCATTVLYSGWRHYD